MQELLKTTGFDDFMAGVDTKPSRFVIRLSGKPALVFRRTKDYDELQEINTAAVKAIRSVTQRACPAEWLGLVGSDPLIAGRAVHMARRHVGVLRWVSCADPGENPSDEYQYNGEGWEKESIEIEPWGELQFMKISKSDPHAFEALLNGINRHCGVGWTIEDRDYFPGEAEGTGE